MADIDFYSPHPIFDLIELCDLLFEKGINNIYGREALHEETFIINYFNITIINISYVPENIYRTIPFDTITVSDDLFDGKKIKNVDTIIVKLRFMLIDYFRLFTDPLESYWRLQKAFTRFNIINELAGFIIPI